MLHQDRSTHEWVPGQHWDLGITLDDATSEHYSMLFVEEEGTASSFQGMVEIIEGWGLPLSLYTDRGSHYWFTPDAGGKADRAHPTQFGRAMRQLGVEMIPAYSPEARGRSVRRGSAARRKRTDSARTALLQSSAGVVNSLRRLVVRSRHSK